MPDRHRDIIDTATTSWVDDYRRLTEVVVPRPIALVPNTRYIPPSASGLIRPHHRVGERERRVVSEIW